MIEIREKLNSFCKPGLQSQQRKRKRANLRQLVLESLEDRRLLTVDWRNPVDSLDVNNDGNVSPLDVLVVINYLNVNTSGALTPKHDPTLPYFDVDGDQTVAPLDVLAIINHLNTVGGGKRVLSEDSGRLSSETNVIITLGLVTGTRHFRVQLDSQFDITDLSAAAEDLFAVYLVDPNLPSTTVLDRGTNGTALFTLAGKTAEFIPGRVSWDGSILDIDLTDLAALDTGLLRFQLLNNDSDSSSNVTIQPVSNVVDFEASSSSAIVSNMSVVNAGPALTLGNLTTFADGQLKAGNIRFDSSTGKYSAEISLLNTGIAIGRNVAVEFPGLPTGVRLESLSGTTSSGIPYINLKPAIQRGGLQQGFSSDPVSVRFDDPSGVPFALRPKILAEMNHPPTLPSIGPLSVASGGILRVELNASDQDGDIINYSLPRASSLPTGSIGADGTLVFRPTISQLGHYTFDVIASDGASEVSRTVTLDVVADPVSTTRVSGKVLKVDGRPIAGMPVEIGSVRVLTQGDGSFTLDLGTGPVISDTIKVRGELFVGPSSYPFIGEKLPLLLEHDVFRNANNLIDRPIYLPVLDQTNAKQIDPTKDKTVTTAAMPGTGLYVAAGTLMNQQGTPYAGKLSITEVPINLTPAALPSGLSPDLVITIQPGEMVFVRPAPLSLPNRAGWGPGTLMNLWSINPVTGEFEDVGDMQVSVDGKTIDTISGGVRNSSWHFASPSPETSPTRSTSRNQASGTEACPLSCPLTSKVESHSGALIEKHDLVTYQSQGVIRGVSLTYDSLRADPQPIVHWGLDNLNVSSILPGYEARGRMAARLVVEEGTLSAVVPGAPASGDPANNIAPRNLLDDEHFWTLPRTPGPVDAALQVDLNDQPSGIYHYQLDSGIYLQRDAIPSGAMFVGSSVRTEGDLISVNSIDSPFGAGWGISGLQQIVQASDRSALLIDGNGSELRFRFDSQKNTYISPVGDFSTLERTAGAFRRTMTDQTVYDFDSQNHLITITDRNQNFTHYNYGAQGQPTGIVDPVGLSTTFTYTGDRVTSITDPAGRQTKLTYDAAGNLTRVTDPDNSFRTWSYDAAHHQTGEVDQLGRHETDTYGFHGRVVSAIRKDGTSLLVNSPETEGLYPADATSDWKNSPLLFLLSANAVSTYVDGNGHALQSVLDSQGQVVSQYDALGFLPSATRDSQNLPIKTTNAHGSSTINSFDSHGNLLTTQDDLSISVRVGDDPSLIGLMTGNSQIAGQKDRYTFSGKSGEFIWLDVMKGSPSITNVTPSGKNFYDSNTPLPEDGTYQVEVQSQPAYRVAIRSLSNAPVILLGTAISRSAEPGEDVIYQFTAKQNERFVLHDDSQVQTGYWQAFGPNGPVGVSYYPQTGNEGSNIEFLVPASGHYYLIHRIDPADSNLQQSLKFTASLTDPVPTAKSGFGIIHSGSLQPGEKATFSFSGTQGSYFYLSINQSDVKLEIHDPQNRLINTLYSSDITQLPMSGTYQIDAIYNFQGSLASHYSFQVIDLDTVTTAQLDSVIKGTIQGRDSNVYRLSGIAGQQFSLELSGDTVNAHIFNLSNFQSYLPPYGILTLPSTGDYCLVIASSSDQANTFAFKSTNLNRIPTVHFGEEISGTFVDPFEEYYYRFRGISGSIIAVKNLESTFFGLQGEGSLGYFPGYYNTESGFMTLPGNPGSESDFVLFAKPDFHNGKTIPQPFHVRMFGPTESHASIVLGQTVTGRIDLNETDTYTFQGTAGATVYLDWRTIETDPQPGFQWQLLGPTDQYPAAQADPSTDYGPIHLPATGTYRLSMFNRNPNSSFVTHSRDYQFRLFDVSASPFVSANSQTSGQLANGSSVSIYQLNGIGEHCLRFQQASTTTKLQLYSPFGQLVADLGASPVQFVSLSHSGAYFLVVSGRDPAVVDPVTFQWNISLADETSVTSSGFNMVYQGTGNEGDVLATFQGNAGSRIYYLASAYLLTNDLKILGPTGQTILQFGATHFPGTYLADVDYGDFVLPDSGTYTVRLNGQSAPLTAAERYNFSLWELKSLDTLDLGTITPLPVSSLYNVPPLKFEAIAGQVFYLNTIFPDSASQYAGDNLHIDVTGPDGQSAGSRGAFIAPYTGTYVVRVTNSGFTIPSLSFKLDRLDTVPKLPIGTNFVGTNAFVYQDVLRRFDVYAGEHLLIQVDSYFWQIYDPLSQTSRQLALTKIEVTPGNFIYEGIADFPLGGTYLLFRTGQYGASLNYSLLMTVFDEPAVPVVGGELTHATYTYDPKFNELMSQTDEQNRQSLLDIDPANGNVRSITYVVGQVGGGDDLVSTITYTPSGQVDTATDPLGYVTDYDYDNNGRLITLTQARRTAQQTNQQFEYNAAGNLTAYVDPNGHRSQYDYDEMDRLIKITSPDLSVTALTYDKRGNLLAVTNALGQTSVNSYDQRDRPLSVSDPGGNTTNYSYDHNGNVIQITDPLGHSTRMQYDARNRLISSTDSVGAKTSFRYDADNNLVSVSDASGNITTYVIDARNRQVSELDPLGKSRPVVYNGVNRVVTTVDRLGRTTKLEYDDAGRVTKEHWIDPRGTEVNTVAYTYDADGNVLSAQDNASTVQFTLDALNRPTQVQTTGANGLPTNRLGYTYDAASNILSMANTINGVADATNAYTYDALDRTTRIVQTGSGVANKRVDLTYNILGQLTGLTRFADSTGDIGVGASSYAYDALSRLTSITHRNAANSVLDSFAYQYDAASRITGITDVDGTTNYIYNSRDELTAANHGDAANPKETYAYDATGNRTASSLHGQGYKTGAGNRLSSDGTFNYSYDDEGNLVQRVTIASGAIREFTFDHRNRLVQVTDRPNVAGAATQVVKYTYDVLNRRIATNVDKTPVDAIDGVTTYFVYDGQDVIEELTDPDGSGPTPATNSMRYLHGPAVDQILAQEAASGTVLWDLTDHLGSVHDLINSHGQIANHLTYDSYGNVVAQSNPAANTRYGYTGREFDSDMGLQYNRGRYYDAIFGQFLSEDPIRFGGGDSNLRRYVANSPIQYSDPDGLTEYGGLSSIWDWKQKWEDWTDKARKAGDAAGRVSTIPEDIKRGRENRDDTPDVEREGIPDSSREHIRGGIKTIQKGTCAIQTAADTFTDNSAIANAKGYYDYANPFVDLVRNHFHKKQLQKQIDKLQKKNGELQRDAEMEKNSPLTPWINKHRAK